MSANPVSNQSGSGAAAEPFRAFQQLIGYLDRHKVSSLILLGFVYPMLGPLHAHGPTGSQYIATYDLIFTAALGIVAVHQTQHFSWQARFAYLQWSSLSSAAEQLVGGSAITVALLLFFVSPLPILSLSVGLLMTWQYVLVAYHRNIRQVSSEVEQVRYKAKVAVESSRRYASEIAAQEQSIMSLVVTICINPGPYSLMTGRPASEIGSLLNGNIAAMLPAAKELTGLASSSSTTLRNAIQTYEQIRWLGDKANLLAEHGEMAEALSVIQSMSAELTSALDAEAQLLSAKARAHDIGARIHLDDVVSSHKKVIDQLQTAVRPSIPDPQPPQPPQPPQGTLPNAVTLRNPKAIVGSLSGAPKDVDDKAFTLDLPFPISIYGHSSSVLSLNDNGMICLDQEPSSGIANVRKGQPLPSRAGLAPYTLFPLWKDLKITKGKPHGIYYDVEGTAPNRILFIEYYVTRYNMESQYFHFLVIFHEARPDFVTFRYHDVKDEGAEGTVGVQGPEEHYQFSYNSRKISPGLELVFNTSPGVNSLETTTFELPRG